ncbi:hypothetical protein [Denitromonas ohlonensis]|uniref:Uncharacterized protein n=2 Tax=Denitromonas TaxID=139331 RepID=A0A558ESE6_9RHOO|nr:hypothetical protein [Denitromonas ohlonensis]TVO67174.1 hypothetical protein FHP90_08430 [Denitromonas ohlonensis]TVO79234.1 hypothetical protein FHP89_03350 [Denitromonas ohlonensis]TVT76277.1 MAG: hypothetical protein FHP92_09660 [Denitromonas halophila]
MKTTLHVAILLALSALFAITPARAADVGADLITELGAANGVALACKHTTNMSAIKVVMIHTVPKTRANGEVFEAATNEAFLGQSGEPCPSETELSQRVHGIDTRLKAHFKSQG